MKKLAIIILSSFIFSGCTIQNLFNKKPAGLEITTTPPSTVFINEEHQGETPYSNNSITPGEYTIKLVPQSEDNLNPWEGKITLNPKATTIINKVFAANETESSGYTLQLKPEASEQEAYISVVSDPDTANISINGQPNGFTPLSKLSVDPGDHTIDITSPGFKPISIGVKAASGYNLIVNAKLAQELIVIEQKESSPSAVIEENSEAKDSELNDLESSEAGTKDSISKPYVIIEETGTGWLRVRQEPNTVAKELGKANVGEKFKLLDTTDNGWYQILFEDEEGWISGKYATIYE